LQLQDTLSTELSLVINNKTAGFKARHHWCIIDT
jgi:hypothetical protein